MTTRVQSSILSEIIDRKRLEAAELHAHAVNLEQRAHERRARVRDFAAALRTKQPAVIAEVKKASPSRGVLVEDFHPAHTAAQYEQGGAACVSVLTDKESFQGSLQDLEAARAACALPVLRKDFVIDRVQIFEAAAHDADAILLIAAVLEVPQLVQFRELAESLGLAALVEVHDSDELKKAIDSGAQIIGVNNRNLNTFEVTLDTSVRLSFQMPSDVIRVSESGIFTRADIDLLRGAGFSAFLVGESLMKSADPVAALKELLRGR